MLYGSFSYTAIQAAKLAISIHAIPVTPLSMQSRSLNLSVDDAVLSFRNRARFEMREAVYIFR